MPRVSERYRDRQSLTISIAARRCFARKGFHATTMDEIIAETGMSPATVYRYFPSKAALVEAVCVQKVGEVAAYIDELTEQDDMPTPGAVLSVTVRALTHATEPGADDEAQVAYLALNVWAELRLNPELRTSATPAYAYLRAGILRAALRWEQEGRLRAGLTPGAAATVVWKFVLGFIADEVISNATDLDGAAADLDVLLLARSAPLPETAVTGAARSSDHRRGGAPVHSAPDQ
ncbi:MAG: helix-turn-helix domain-containing protein [Pseudoclavibacter sp.]